MDPFEIKCPGCETILIVDRKTGKVLEARKPLLENGEGSGDRFEDARKRVEQSGDRIAQKVEAARRAESEKLKKLDALFKERQKEISETGEEVERPENPFDRH